MPGRPRNSIPSLRHHKPTGRGVVTINGHDRYLGRWPRDQAEAPPAVRAEYDRVIAEWLAAGRRPDAVTPEKSSSSGGPTVSDLILAFWGHAEKHYRRADGTATSELDDYRLSLRPLRELYADLPARDLSPLKLKAVRQRMIDGKEYRVRRLDRESARPRWVGWRRVKDGRAQLDKDKKNWVAVEVLGERPELCRSVVNQRIGRIVRMYKWAVAEELVSNAVHEALTKVSGLQRGRTEARETAPVLPVADADVEAILPHLTPAVAAMVRLQRLTGARPGEVCALKIGDLDMSGPVWIYRPPMHKTSHKGRDRLIAVGPQAQAVLRPFLDAAGDGYAFSPRRTMEAFRAGQRAARKTKLQPSQKCRKKRRPKKRPGDRYTTRGYCQSVAKACRKARVEPWHPHQLRHTHATAVRQVFGLEAAQVALGHAQANVTQMYAERDMTLASKVAAQLG
jgi:integrase